MEKKEKKTNDLLRLIHGALIGLGAVLPGISGGVLCVVFGVYQTIMELLSHPFRTFKKNMRVLIPLLIGVVLGFLGIAKLLGFLLEKYPNPSVCLFVGLIGGMLPSLFREAGLKGRTKGSWAALIIAFAIILTLLVSLENISLQITTGFGAWIFCGFCLALSVIALGMSFSTLLMPLGLYQPFVDGIGNLDFSVLIPAGIGAAVTIILFAKAVTWLIGVVIAATLVIIPFASFTAGFGSFIINIVCFVIGVVAALALDKFNQSVEKPE